MGLLQAVAALRLDGARTGRVKLAVLFPEQASAPDPFGLLALRVLRCGPLWSAELDAFDLVHTGSTAALALLDLEDELLEVALALAAGKRRVVSEMQEPLGGFDATAAMRVTRAVRLESPA